MHRREFLTATMMGLISGQTLSAGFFKETPNHKTQSSISFEHFIELTKHEGLLEEFCRNYPQLLVEDYGFCSRSESERREISQVLKKYHLNLGLFSGSLHYGRPVFSSGQKADQRVVLEEMEKAFNLTENIGGNFCTIIPGTRLSGISWKRQSENAVDFLKSLSDIAMKKNRILLLEPVNYLDKNSKIFLSGIEQAFEICDRVNHPCCKILYDFRQQGLLNRSVQKDVKMFGSRIGYYQLDSNTVPGLDDQLRQLVKSNSTSNVVIGNIIV